MSALAGFWSWSAAERPDPSCQTILAAQRRYGPDRSGLWTDGDIALGRALYALLPEDRYDRQPLHGSHRACALVADVRIDNRDDLLGQLGLADIQANLSDADVLLGAFERWGFDCLEHISGDFAFAVWDAGARKLSLVRDPLGQRPLYFHRSSGFFAFASMPVGLHALPNVARQPNMARLADFVGLLPFTGSDGFYEGIERVEPGHILTVTRSGISSRRYWAPRATGPLLKSFNECTEAFRAALDRSVRVRLRGAGDRIGAHLSGGWDSSAVTATAARLIAGKSGNISAYTSVPRPGSVAIGGQHDFYDETELAAATAARYSNVQHVIVPGAGRSPFADLDQYVAAFGRPVYNLSNHVWITDIRELQRAADVRVVLTGEVGNYTISSAPYTILADYLRQGRWLDWLHEARALAAGRSARYRGIAANSFGPWLPRHLWTLVRPLSSRAEVATATALNPNVADAFDRRREREEVGLARRPRNYHEAISEGLMSLDHGDFRKGALGGWGLDERDPTADRQLIEFCLSLPIDMILKNGVRRPLARVALSDRLPAVVLDEKRKGLQAADWHEGLTNSRTEMLGLLEELSGNERANALLDIATLRFWLRDWPTSGWNDPVIINRYRRALPIALTAGHFILSTTR